MQLYDPNQLILSALTIKLYRLYTCFGTIDKKSKKHTYIYVNVLQELYNLYNLRYNLMKIKFQFRYGSIKTRHFKELALN
jgi:hypothetical protein